MERISINICPPSILTENTLIQYSSRNNDGRPNGRNVIININ